MLESIKRALLSLLPTTIAGRLRAWRVNRSIRTFSDRVVERTYGTGPLRVHLSDPMAQGWYDRDWAELPEIAALRGDRLRPGARIFNLGAHQGVVALMLAREVGDEGRVVAVEPSPHNAAAALRNRDLNGMRQVEVVQAAVSDREGTIAFNARLNGQLDDGSGSGGLLEVPSVTVDALADRFGIPDVVFLDVEGAELMALRGAERVLASGADFCVEVHVGCGLERLGGSVDEVISRFRAADFTLVARADSDDAFHPLAEDEPLTRSRFFLLARAPRGRRE